MSALSQREVILHTGHADFPDSVFVSDVKLDLKRFVDDERSLAGTQPPA